MFLASHMRFTSTRRSPRRSEEPTRHPLSSRCTRNNTTIVCARSSSISAAGRRPYFRFSITWFTPMSRSRSSRSMSATVLSRKPRWIFSVGRDAVEVLATTAGDRNRRCDHNAALEQALRHAIRHALIRHQASLRAARRACMQATREKVNPCFDIATERGKLDWPVAGGPQHEPSLRQVVHGRSRLRHVQRMIGRTMAPVASAIVLACAVT